MPDENDQNLNPGQSDYNRKTAFDPNGKSVNENSDQQSTADELQKAEENPDGDWKNNFKAQKEAINYSQSKDMRKGKAMIRLAKKKGPLTAIILSVAGGGLMITTLLSPGLLLVNLKEVMVKKFNYQNASMSVRSTKLLVSKMGTTSDLCTSVVSIRCKYSSMSEKQVANFEKAGIKVNYGEATITTTTETIRPDGTKSTTVTKEVTGSTSGLKSGNSTEYTYNANNDIETTVTKEISIDNKKSVFGRIKPTSFEFKGETFLASGMNKIIKSSGEIRSALYKAYNPIYAGFSDSIWKKAAMRLGISKTAKDLSGATDDEKLKKIQEEVEINKENIDDIKEGATKPDGGEYTADEAAEAKRLAKEASELTAEGTESVGKKALNAFGDVAGTTVNTVKITGVADEACDIYRTVKAVSIAAKTVRSVQLAKYAMLFLGVADQIKAGTAKADDVSYLGKILTTQTISENGQLKSATDSFGYKYAAYGDRGAMPTSTSRFMAGGGLSGKMSNIMSLINKHTGGTPNTTCKILANPFVQVGSFITGLLAWLGAETVVLGAYDVAKVAAIGGLSVASYFLPSMLDDIVAGVLVDKTTVGEDSGDGYTSGAAGIMASIAKFGGNGPLTPAQATKYTNFGKVINNQYNDIAVNQFDINNTDSFISKFASILIPYIPKTNSITDGVGSILSLSTGSISKLIANNSYAASNDEFTTCTDLDYQSISVATDPFCNIIYGIEPDALEIDPNTVNDELLSNSYDKPQIDEITGEPINEYSDFVEKCINRINPLGTPDDEEGDGKDCMFGNTYPIGSSSINNKYYYLHYIDQRVNKGMDGEDPILNAAIDSGYDTNLSFYDSKTKSKSDSDSLIAKIFNIFGIGN